MTVNRNTLLPAGLVWSAAGINILRIGLRTSGFVPERFIAVFYTGLGASLLAASLLFGRNYGRSSFAAVQSKT